MNEQELKNIIEAVLFAVDHPMTVKQLEALFPEDTHDGEFQVDAAAIKQALQSIAEDYAERSVELREVGSGYRFQVKQDYAEWVSRLWEEKPARYSRATLETMALIAYRQPITRAEIEEVRGVSVSTTIIKTLTEREWIKVVGHRDVPGKPALYATTKNFLDYFNLSSLEDLPSLAEIRDIDSINAELDLALPEDEQQQGEQALDDEMAEGADAEGGAVEEAVDAEANQDAIDLAAELDSAMALADSIVETSQQAMRDRAEESDEETEASVDDDNETVSEVQANDSEQANEDQTGEEQAANDSDVEASAESGAEGTEVEVSEVSDETGNEEETVAANEATDYPDNESVRNEADGDANSDAGSGDLNQALTAEN